MPTQIAVSSEHFATSQAMIGFDVGVRQQMGLEVRTLIETALANGALVRRLLHVENLVNGQGARLAEAFAAFQAFERFLFRMNVSGK